MKNFKGKKTKDDKIIKLVPPKFYSSEQTPIILDDRNLVTYEGKPTEK